MKTDCLFFCMLFSPSRETNLKFKMGLKVSHERLQEENQLANFDGKPNSRCACFADTSVSKCSEVSLNLNVRFYVVAYSCTVEVRGLHAVIMEMSPMAVWGLQ